MCVLLPSNAKTNVFFFFFLIPFVWEKLKQMGFRHFVGVDGSLRMLELAKKTGLYQQLTQCLLGQDEISAGNEPYHTMNVFGVYYQNVTK